MAFPVPPQLDLPREEERQTISASIRPLEWALTCNLTRQGRRDTLRRVFFKHRRVFEILRAQGDYLDALAADGLDRANKLLVEQANPENRPRLRQTIAAQERSRWEKSEMIDRLVSIIEDKLWRFAEASVFLDHPVEFRAAMRKIILDT